MASVRSCLLVLYLLLAVCQSAPFAKKRGLRKHTRHTPKESDYFADDRPVIKDHFDHMFPALQPVDDWADDFVKDSKSDGGEWKLQSEYDRLRVKLAEVQASRKELAVQEEKLLGEEKEAAEKVGEVEAESKKREEEAAEEEEKLEKAEREARNATAAEEDHQALEEKSISELKSEIQAAEEERKYMKEWTADAEAELKNMTAEIEKADLGAKLRRLEEKYSAAREIADKVAEKDRALWNQSQKLAIEVEQAKQAYHKQVKTLEKSEVEFKEAELKLRKIAAEARREEQEDQAADSNYMGNYTLWVAHSSAWRRRCLPMIFGGLAALVLLLALDTPSLMGCGQRD